MNWCIGQYTSEGRIILENSYSFKYAIYFTLYTKRKLKKIINKAHLIHTGQKVLICCGGIRNTWKRMENCPRHALHLRFLLVNLFTFKETFISQKVSWNPTYHTQSRKYAAIKTTRDNSKAPDCETTSSTTLLLRHIQSHHLERKIQNNLPQ